MNNEQISFSIMYGRSSGSSDMFAACDNTYTIHNIKWVTMEPTQTSDMT